MPNSLSERLRQGSDCEQLMEWFHGLGGIDEAVFRALAAAEEPLTVDEVADVVGRDRSTAYRAVQRLLEAGFVRQEQVNYDRGGYYHVYEPTDASEIAEEMERLLDDWYAEMEQLVRVFEAKYDESDGTARPAE